MRVSLAIVSLFVCLSPCLAQDEVEFPTPKGWEQVASTGELRFAEYRPLGETGPELVIFRFDGHGEVDPVIDRWLSRIEQPDGRPTREAAALTRWTRGGLTLHLVDARGTRLPSKSHAREGAPTEPLPHWRLLAAVLIGPGGPYFIRLEGSESQLADLADGFFALVFGAQAPK